MKLLLATLLIAIVLSLPRHSSAGWGCEGTPPTCGAGEALSCNCPDGPMSGCAWACEDPNKSPGGC